MWRGILSIVLFTTSLVNLADVVSVVTIALPSLAAALCIHTRTVPAELLVLLFALYGLVLGALPVWLTILVLFLDSALPLAPWPAFRQSRLWAHTVGRLHGHRVIVRADGTDIVGTKPTPTLYVIYPHGHLALSSILTFAIAGSRRTIPDATRLAAHHILLRLPLTRRICAWGGLVSADRAVILHELITGHHDVAVVTEGTRAMTVDTPPRSATSLLRMAWEEERRCYRNRNERPRFVLRPVYAHGEREIVSVIGRDCWVWLAPALSALQRVTKQWLGYPLPMPFFYPAIDRPLAQTTVEILERHHLAGADESFEAYAARVWQALDEAEKRGPPPRPCV